MKLFQRIRSSIVWRYKQWAFRPYSIKRQVAGEKIQFLIGDLFGEGWYGPHHHIWPELDWIKEHGIRSNDIVVDCGANHGFTTTLFGKWAGPRGKVYAIEPSRHNVSILKENLRLNGVTNVICCHAAAGATTGSVAISNRPNAAIVARPRRRDRVEQTALVALDDAVEAPVVNFLKVDVEGYELAVLHGATRILSCAPRLDLELHILMFKDAVAEVRQIFELVSLNRYHAEIQTEVDGPIRPFDKNVHTPSALSKLQVVHLFCR